jgi:arginase
VRAGREDRYGAAMPTTPAPIIVVGSPTALGGHFGGMERTPNELRRLGLLDRLAARPGLARVPWIDAGDAANDPGWAPDPDPRAKNRAAIVAYLPRLAAHVADSLSGPVAATGEATDQGDEPGRGPGREPGRLLLLGGDCTSHAGALAGLRRARPGMRVGVVWFDAHGDFNTPDSTPSGNVWGMPFAMLCGHGGPDLLAACDAPLVAEADAALVGGQVLDEPESRALAASSVAHFGAGMLGDDAGRAALAGWAAVVAGRIDAWYIAVDLDAIDAGERLAVAMPEPAGLSLDAARRAIEIVAATGPVAGFGASAAMFPDGGDRGVRDDRADGRADPTDDRDDLGADPELTVAAVALLAEAALGSSSA